MDPNKFPNLERQASESHWRHKKDKILQQPELLQVKSQFSVNEMRTLSGGVMIVHSGQAQSIPMQSQVPVMVSPALQTPKTSKQLPTLSTVHRNQLHQTRQMPKLKSIRPKPPPGPPGLKRAAEVTQRYYHPYPAHNKDNIPVNIYNTPRQTFQPDTGTASSHNAYNSLPNYPEILRSVMVPPLQHLYHSSCQYPNVMSIVTKKLQPPYVASEPFEISEPLAQKSDVIKFYQSPEAQSNILDTSKLSEQTHNTSNANQFGSHHLPPNTPGYIPQHLTVNGSVSRAQEALNAELAKQKNTNASALNDKEIKQLSGQKRHLQDTDALLVKQQANQNFYARHVLPAHEIHQNFQKQQVSNIMMNTALSAPPNVLNVNNFSIPSQVQTDNRISNSVLVFQPLLHEADINQRTSTGFENMNRKSQLQSNAKRSFKQCSETPPIHTFGQKEFSAKASLQDNQSSYSATPSIYSFGQKPASAKTTQQNLKDLKVPQKHLEEIITRQTSAMETSSKQLSDPQQRNETLNPVSEIPHDNLQQTIQTEQPTVVVNYENDDICITSSQKLQIEADQRHTGEPSSIETSPLSTQNNVLENKTLSPKNKAQVVKAIDNRNNNPSMNKVDTDENILQDPPKSDSQTSNETIMEKEFLDGLKSLIYGLVTQISVSNTLHRKLEDSYAKSEKNAEFRSRWFYNNNCDDNDDIVSSSGLEGP